jgi:integrase
VEARRILAKVATGADPSAQKQELRKAATVTELCDLYLKDAEAGRILTRRKQPIKASSIKIDQGRVIRHICPLLGKRKAASITPRDIEKFRDDVSEGVTAARIKMGKHALARVTGGRGAATRTLALLGSIFTYAIRRGIRSDNPVSGIETRGYEARQRRLSDAEYRELGKALRMMPERAWPIAIAATSFLIFTGWRRGEMLALKWSEIDLASRTARLADTKTGASLRPLSSSACEILRAIPRLGPLVFPQCGDVSKPMGGYHKTWLRVAAKAGLASDVTPHVLRHSFASVAVDLGHSELTIAALLGHKKASITSKYAHHADAVMLAAADRVASHIFMQTGDVSSFLIRNIND